MSTRQNKDKECGRNRSPFKLTSVLFALSLFGLAACDGGSHNPQEPVIEYAHVRVIHASSDAPPVNVKLSGDTTASDLDYAESTNYAEIVADTYDISVEGILPTTTAEVISVPGFDFAADSKTTIVAIDPVSSIKPWVLGDSAAMPTGSEVALHVAHASSVAPEVDVYVTAPGADINAASPAFTFDYEESVDVGAIAAGTVHIRVTPTGTKDVVYDSGPVDLSGFAGEKLLLLAVNTETPTKQAASLVKIVVAADDAALTLYDVNTQAGARVVHASPDATSAAGGDVEVFATSTALNGSVELIPAFGYLETVPDITSHVAVPAGDYVFDVAPDTDMIGDSVFTSGSIPLAAGMEYTVVAAGRVTNSPVFGLLLSADESRPIATQASVKVIHAAPAAGNVQVYVHGAGAYSVADIEGGLAGDPLLNDFAFADITGYVPLDAGSYDIRVVAGGTVAINVEGLALAGGSVSTIIARGPSEPSGTPTDFGVVLLTN